MSTPDRLRIASLLLAERDSEDTVRTPLAAEQTRAAIRAMSNAQRVALGTHVDWVRDYEAQEAAS